MSTQKPKRAVSEKATPAKAATPAPARKTGLELDPRDDDSSWLSPVLKFAALGLICLISFSIRLFAVARWESVRARCEVYERSCVLRGGDVRCGRGVAA